MHRSKLQIVVIISLLQLSSFICAGHECGNNPMKSVLLVAKRTGRTLGSVLSLLKEIDNPAYDNLSRHFRTYAACVGLVDTGYFRKRSSSSPTSSYPPRFHWEYYTPDVEEFDTPNLAQRYARPFDERRDQQQHLEHSHPPSVEKKSSRKLSVDRLKKWLYGPYRNYMNSYYLRWNLLWPLVDEE